MSQSIPGEEIIIRPASFNDIPYIQQIAYETWPVAYGQILSAEQLAYMLELIYSKEALTKQMQENHHFFLGLKNFHPVAFAGFSQSDARTCKLQKLYVSPALQKSGAGKLMLQHVEEIVKSLGATHLQLNVNRQNPALSFYQKHGFSVIETVDINIGQGFFMNDYIMEKSL